MERIGIAASKMAKGNLLFYNLYVFLLAFLFSLLIFFIAGISIVLSLILIGYIANQMAPATFGREAWLAVIRVCMISLTIAVGVVSLFAVLRNIKFKKD